MTVRTGFIKSLTGVCSGREVFRPLRFQSWKTIVWHLFLLSLITGIITGIVQTGRIEPDIKAVKIAFTDVFGEKIYAGHKNGAWNWTAPVKTPERPGEMSLPGGGRLYYTGTSRQVPGSLKNTTGAIVIWTPERVLFLQNNGSGYTALQIKGNSGEMSNLELSAAQLEKVFSGTPAALPPDLQKMPTEDAGAFFDGMTPVLNFFISAGTVLKNFLLVWLYTGIFMAMYRLLNGPSGRLRNITLGEMWKCGIYAAFPPMITASLFPILELPFLSYETVFMMGLLIYWMAVIAKLERTPDYREE